MSNSPRDDQRLDDDHTDELPVLLETVVLDADDPRLPAAEHLEETGEHTAHFPAVAAEAADLEGLKIDLAARGAKIEALEADIGKVTARWVDVERHLTTKDVLIADLKQTLAELRESLAERGATEQRVAVQLGGRDTELRRVLDERERLTRDLTLRTGELGDAQLAARAARDDAAALREQLAAAAASGSEADASPTLREELATLSTYIANRRSWWDEIEARAAQSATQITTLERELADGARRQQRAESFAERETVRATALRAELVEHARLVETLRRELATARANTAEPAPPAAELPAELASARAAVAQLTAELAAAREAHAAQITELGAREAARTTSRPVGTAPFGDRQALPGDAAAVAPPEPAFEVIAQLEAVVEHKRQQVSAQLVELRDRDHRLTATEQRLEASRAEVAAIRTELDQTRTDTGRLERALLDKDRALEARDARIATLQEELNQRLGAVQKLNALDASLQGLDSKMSERLRRTEPATHDHNNTPALVCLTGDAPRQFALTKKAAIIGRGSHCDVQILTHFVSREHARVTVTRDSAVIEDMGSTNGVFVNSVRVDRHELRQGDLITVGETQFRFLESMAH